MVSSGWTKGLLISGSFLCVVGKLTALVGVLGFLFQFFSTHTVVWLIGCGFMSVVIGLAMSIRAFGRALIDIGERLLQFDGRVCPDCGYPLRGLCVDPIVCSECGASYSEQNLRQIWRGWDIVAKIERRSC